MKRLLVGMCALGWLAVEVGPVTAAWDNVFQTTLFGRFRRQHVTNYYFTPAPVVAASPAPCCAPVVQAVPCPQQCTTQYTQRCFYTPVTTYQTQTFYEPVTTYQTSYYYAPVTSYRYSCYYDPSTCSYQQVAVPTQAYELRAKSCPVQSWVQRCAAVPVTSYQKSCYLYPQTTCCTTTQGTPIPVGVPTAPPPLLTAPPPPGPGVTEQRSLTVPPPLIDEKRNGPMSWQPQIPTPNGQVPAWQPSVNPPAQPVSPAPPPVKLDRIVVGPDSSVNGQVLRSDNSPRANAKVLFVRADRQGPIQTVSANSAGRFHVTLASGGWLVYLTNPDGSQAYHSRIDIGGPNEQITLR